MSKKIQYILEHSNKYDDKQLRLIETINPEGINRIYQKIKNLRTAQELKFNQKNTPKKRKQIENREKKLNSESYESIVKQYRHTLLQITKKLLKKYDENLAYAGIKTIQLFLLVKGLSSTHLKTKGKYILPTYKFLADVLNCSEDWVNRLVLRFQKLLNLKRIDKQDINPEQKKWAKYKNFVWVIESTINYVFSELKESVYFFRTNFWKQNINYNSKVDDDWFDLYFT